MANKKLMIVVLFLVGAVLVSAQTDPKPSKSVVRGKVILSNTGNPAPNVRITLTELKSSFRLITTTNDAGSFEFRDLEPGVYFAIADKAGFVMVVHGVEGIRLDSGDNKEFQTIALAPAAVISGVISGPDGNPISGAKVWLYSKVYEVGGTWLRGRGPARTDSSGGFRTPALQPGDYFIAATYDSQEGASEQIQQRVAYPIEFYPGVTDEASAQPLHIDPGTEPTKADISLRPAPAVRLRGQLVGINRSPVAPAIVTIRKPFQSDKEVRIVSATSAGEFEFLNVVPGDYVMEAVDYNEGELLLGRVPVTVGASDLSGITVELRNTVRTISGKVISEAGIGLDSSAFDVKFYDLKGPTPLTRSVQLEQISPGSDGSFEAYAREGASLTLNVLPQNSEAQNWYTKSIRASGKDVTESGFVVDGAAGDVVLEVVEASDGGNIQLKIVNSEGIPIPNKEAVFVPEKRFSKSPFRYKRVWTGPDGTILVKGVAPGDYRIAIERDSDPDGFFLTEEFLNSRTTQQVHVEPKSAYKITVTAD